MPIQKKKINKKRTKNQRSFFSGFIILESDRCVSGWGWGAVMGHLFSLLISSVPTVQVSAVCGMMANQEYTVSVRATFTLEAFLLCMPGTAAGPNELCGWWGRHVLTSSRDP
jgi:hypothetical protein